MESPRPLTLSHCIEIFRDSCEIEDFGTDKQIGKVLRHFGSKRAGFNPFAATLVAKAVRPERHPTFNEFYSEFTDRFSKLGTTILVGDEDSDELRKRHINFAYEFAFESLSADIATQAALLALAQLPAGVSSSKTNKDLDLLSRQQDENWSAVDGIAVQQKLYDRALAYVDKSTHRLMLLDPLRVFLRQSKAPKATGELESQFIAIRNGLRLHYLQFALDASGLGGGNDAEIVAPLTREFANALWAVGASLDLTAGDSLQAKIWVKAAYGLCLFNNWTGRGRRQCEDFLEGVRKRFPQNAQTYREASTLLGHSKRMQGLYDRAEPLFKEADEGAGSTDDLGLRIWNTIGMAECARSRYDLKEAMLLFDQARSGCESAGVVANSILDIERLHIGLYWRRAEVEKLQYDLDSAWKNYDSAEQRYQKRKDWQGTASGLLGKSEICRLRGALREAVLLLRRAKIHYRKASGENYDAECSLAIAECRLAMAGPGNPRAIQSIQKDYETTAKVFRRLDGYEIELAWCEWGIGECLRRRNQLSEATKQFTDVLQSLNSGKRKQDCACNLWCHWSLWQIAKDRENTALAEKHWSEKLRRTDSIKSPLTRAWKLRQMGDLASQHSHPDKARVLYSEAEATFIELGRDTEASAVREARLRGL
jgi:tetratricopeptide (TPR) repeat protein